MISVPLSKLRTRAPQGAPVICHGAWEHIPHTLLHDFGDGIVTIAAQGLASREVDVRGVSLDLSEPTTDRFDGADVAARMLAKAAGLDLSGGLLWSHRRSEPLRWAYLGLNTANQSRHYRVDFALVGRREALAAVLLAELGVEHG